MAVLLGVFLGAYLCGSVPFGLLLTRLAGLGDIRKIGSGNIGATNVLRTGHRKLAALTLLLDAVKGTIPVVLTHGFFPALVPIAALGAFLGHIYPVWLKFNGGKGVATALGVAFGLSTLFGAMLAGIWLLVAALTRYSSLSAITAFIAAPFLAHLLFDEQRLTMVLSIIAGLLIVRHHQNIRRLLNGTESKINVKGG
jgi:glycerol-3-phosphate acyltransferase PlsY